MGIYTLDNSTTTFYAPLWTENYQQFTAALSDDKRYKISPKKPVPQYLLPYITNIFCDDNLFMEFRLQPEYFPDLSVFDTNFNEGGSAELADVRVCCFSTGCILLEFQIEYHNLLLDYIADFSYKFKNANSEDPDHPEKVKMIDAISDLMPPKANVTSFFDPSNFKNDCKMFHRIFLKDSIEEEELKKHLIHLRRGYHREFPIPRIDDTFDMLFSPYDYDNWAGSQEGIVNIYNLTDNATTNSYLTKHKPEQLSLNYRFMYLVLLNQRFSAISLLGKIPLLRSYTRKQREKLNIMISSLKTNFSFSIVSDDQLYQTVYSKMYTILGIDRLLADVHENEEQIDLLQQNELLDTEKMTSSFLFGLSVLSLFSVLVDAAGYFDRIPFLQSISTVLSFTCLLTIIVIYIFWWIRYRKK